MFSPLAPIRAKDKKFVAGSFFMKGKFQISILAPIVTIICISVLSDVEVSV